MTSRLLLGWHGPDAVPGLRAEILDVHRDAHAGLIDSDFYSPERFDERLDWYVRDPGFTLVTGRVDGVLAGFAFGGVLPEQSRWWTGLNDYADPDVIRETGDRTFALRELQVRKAHQRRGYGKMLADAILSGRSQERATLLVREDNPARRLYGKWGWREVGTMQPFPDAPIMKAMVLQLAIGPNDKV